MSEAHKPQGNKTRGKLLPQPLPEELAFEEAVAAVLHAPPLPEQQAKKAKHHHGGAITTPKSKPTKGARGTQKPKQAPKGK